MSTERVEPSTATSSGKSITKIFEYVTAADSVYTSSTGHVPVADMSRNFQTLRPQALLITFSAMTWARDDDIMYVVARVDGVDAEPGEVQFDADSDEDLDGKWARCHSFQWVYPELKPGRHTVVIYFRSFTGSTAGAHSRTLSVFHSR